MKGIFKEVEEKFHHICRHNSKYVH